MGNLTKAGSGTLVLSSNASTYTGLTYVNQGIVQVQAAGALGRHRQRGGRGQRRQPCRSWAPASTISKPLVLNGSGTGTARTSPPWRT